MTYPKKVMSITEMVDVGYPRAYMNQMVNIPGQDFAFKTSEKGKWMIDTEAFEKFKEKRQKRMGRTGEVRSGKIRLIMNSG